MSFNETVVQWILYRIVYTVPYVLYPRIAFEIITRIERSNANSKSHGHDSKRWIKARLVCSR